jgi:hypothetical protein
MPVLNRQPSPTVCASCRKRLRALLRQPASHRRLRSQSATNPNDPASTFRLRSPRWDAGGFTFLSNTLTGRVYRVETRAQGSATSWQETMVAEGTGAEFLFQPRLPIW